MCKKKVNIAYIGGGSRGWAWTLMKDLTKCDNLFGNVALYDIDYEAAVDNEIIGNRIAVDYPDKANWKYKAYKSIGEALTNADFVVISILPGTFKEMRVDVHAPEEYGIYQPVGDTIGPGGVIRSLRTIPMFEVIAKAVEQYCPDAWVINYTNPMSVCVNVLYKTFPKIKAFGCCHEVFGTQNIISKALAEIMGIQDIPRQEIITDVTGLNHFTWLTSAKYKDMDLMPIYREYANIHIRNAADNAGDGNWMNRVFDCSDAVKFDLFLKYGFIAAAGDRHLAEFCPPDWYTKSPETVRSWGFALTTVDWREEDLKKRIEKSFKLKTAQEKLTLEETGEEGVLQMQAISGLHDLITNVNLPNIGQIANLPLGIVVETNAVFTENSVKPVENMPIPKVLTDLFEPIVRVQELSVKAGLERDLDTAFEAFCADPHVATLKQEDARRLFHKMIEGTKEYLGDYFC